MKRLSRAFLVKIALSVLIGFLIIEVALNFLKGYDGSALLFESKEFLAPSQSSYQLGPETKKAIDLLSDRWKKNPDTLYVLAFRQVDSIKEVGIVDSSSLSSARIIISESDQIDGERISANPITKKEQIYLMNEFTPGTRQEMHIASTFYSTAIPSLGKSQQFGVIVWWNVTTSGNGYIKALTNSGYFNVPVIGGLVLKRLAGQID